MYTITYENNFKLSFSKKCLVFYMVFSISSCFSLKLNKTNTVCVVNIAKQIYNTKLHLFKTDFKQVNNFGFI